MNVRLLDVDVFKRYNDRYGYQVGDDFLRRVANIIKTSMKRSGDQVARYCGEEFACMLPRRMGATTCEYEYWKPFEHRSLAICSAKLGG